VPTGSVTTTGGGSSTGTSGTTGSTGKTGSTGSTGSTGTTGSTGSTGIAVNPAAGTPNANGVGPVAVGATNTIIYQINGGAAVTASSGTGYQLSFTCLDYGGGVGQTGLFAVSSTGVTITITYLGLTAGTYLAPGGFVINTSTYNLADNLATEKINVSTQNVTPTALGSISQATGTIKGTFDGTMVDSNSGLSYRVSGSFNMSQ